MVRVSEVLVLASTALRALYITCSTRGNPRNEGPLLFLVCRKETEAQED